MNWEGIRYFKPEEFRCPCCEEEHMDREFVQKLDELRSRSVMPLKVNSGYRCPDRDLAVGGSGNHTQGCAADIAVVSSQTRFIVLGNALQLGFKRIGIGKTFIHLDTCPDKPRFVLWLY